MFEDLKEYLNWTASRTDLSDEARGPVIGLFCSAAIVTGDDAHYVATIQELEFRGARVIPIFCGGLDFSSRSMPSSMTRSIPSSRWWMACLADRIRPCGWTGRPDHQGDRKSEEAQRPRWLLPLVFQTTGMGAERSGSSPGSGGSSDRCS